eukprot:1067318-Rhodomonas_salina.2
MTTFALCSIPSSISRRQGTGPVACKSRKSAQYDHPARRNTRCGVSCECHVCVGVSGNGKLVQARRKVRGGQGSSWGKSPLRPSAATKRRLGSCVSLSRQLCDNISTFCPPDVFKFSTRCLFCTARNSSTFSNSKDCGTK